MSRCSRAARSVSLALVLAGLLAACDQGWGQADGGPDRRRANPGEERLTTANVSSLQHRYTIAESTGPAVVGANRVYVTSVTTLYALDKATGALLWSRSHAGYVIAEAATASGPVIEGADSVRVSFHHPETGDDYEVVYGSDGAGTPASASYPPGFAPDDHELVAVRGDRRLHRFARGAGTELVGVTATSFKGWIGMTGPPATLGPDDLYTVEASGSQAATLNAYGFDEPCPPADVSLPDLCTPRWRVQVPRYSSSPAIGPDRNLYLASSFDAPQATSVDRVTGVIRWQVPTSVPGGTPSVDGGSLYLAGTSASTTALEARDMADGSLRWKADLAADTDDGAAEITAVGGDVVYVSAGSTVAAFPADGCGQTTCDPLWTAPVPGTVSGLAVTGGRLYVGTDAGLVVFALPA